MINPAMGKVERLEKVSKDKFPLSPYVPPGLHSALQLTVGHMGTLGICLRSLFPDALFYPWGVNHAHLIDLFPLFPLSPYVPPGLHSALQLTAGNQRAEGFLTCQALGSSALLVLRTCSTCWSCQKQAVAEFSAHAHRQGWDIALVGYCYSLYYVLTYLHTAV